jgi:hypothetical protein
MQRRSVMLLLAGTTAMLLLAGLAMAIHFLWFSDLPFDSERWKHQRSSRWRQLADIQHKFAAERWDAGRLYDELGSDLPGESRASFVERVMGRAGIKYAASQVPSLKGHNKNLDIFVHPDTGVVGEWKVIGE